MIPFCTGVNQKNSEKRGEREKEPQLMRERGEKQKEIERERVRKSIGKNVHRHWQRISFVSLQLIIRNYNKFVNLNYLVIWRVILLRPSTCA